MALPFLMRTTTYWGAPVWAKSFDFCYNYECKLEAGGVSISGRYLNIGGK
jgi:hypothetical protein